MLTHEKTSIKYRAPAAIRRVVALTLGVSLLATVTWAACWYLSNPSCPSTYTVNGIPCTLIDDTDSYYKHTAVTNGSGMTTYTHDLVTQNSCGYLCPGNEPENVDVHLDDKLGTTPCTVSPGG